MYDVYPRELAPLASGVGESLADIQVPEQVTADIGRAKVECGEINARIVMATMDDPTRVNEPLFTIGVTDEDDNDQPSEVRWGGVGGSSEGSFDQINRNMLDVMTGRLVAKGVDYDRDAKVLWLPGAAVSVKR